MSTKIWTLILNITIIAASTYTAITFDKWWIILIGFCFLYTYKEERQASKHYKICDGCGKRSESAESPEKALEKAAAAGWMHINRTDEDYCPECLEDRVKFMTNRGIYEEVN